MNENQDLSDQIAIIAMNGKFPGAENIEEFWSNLKTGKESVSFFYKDNKLTSADAVLDNIDMFDAEFFDFSPREAELLDPQHRLFLEAVFEVMEYAGYTSGKFPGKIAIFAGSNLSSYMIRNLYSNPGLVEEVGTFKTMLANGQDFLATRISYLLNLTGPSVNVNTLCSSSLVAVHYACQSLLNFESDLAIAGGVNIQVSRNEAFFYQEGGIGSADGHCRAFDEKANGTVSGSGLGVIVLKRLEEALEDNDNILAVIRGSAVNNDGENKNSYTAPNPDGQAECILEAIAASNINPETISYIEAHGTGTNLGDPIEIAGLTRAFRAYTQKKTFCAVGSVKTNIGHLVTAGGIASLIKTILAMQHNLLPASLNFERPNPKIDFDNSPFFVNTELRDWTSHSHPLRAGVSSFGIGGTNAHVVLEQAPEQIESEKSRPWQMVFLSARTEAALKNMMVNLTDHLKNTPHLNPADVAYTLQVGRQDFACKKVFLCENTQDLLSSLEKDNGLYSFKKVSGDPELIFVLPEISDWQPGMFSEIYDNEPVFRNAIDDIFQIIRSKNGIDLSSYFSKTGESDTVEKEMNKQKIIQLMGFAFAIGLSRLLEKWGVVPLKLYADGAGGLAAGCLAGLLSLEDAVQAVLPDYNIGPEFIKILNFDKYNDSIYSLRDNIQLSEEKLKSADYWKQFVEKKSAYDLPFDIKIPQNAFALLIHPEMTVIDVSGQDSQTKKISDKNYSDYFMILNCLVHYWLAGGRIDWSGYYANEKRKRVVLPSYAFERKRYWIEPGHGHTKSVVSRDYIPDDTESKNNSENIEAKLKKSPRPELDVPFLAPENKTQRIIAASWEKVLGIEKIGIEDSFFELGGHSLLAAAIASSLSEKFNLQIPLQELLAMPTIRQLAEYIDLQEWAVNAAADKTKFEMKKTAGQGIEEGEI